MSAEKIGRWNLVFELSNFAVHSSLLHTGKVLYWGRRANPRAKPDASGLKDSNMDENFAKAFVWDPANPSSPSIPPVEGLDPRDMNGEKVNIFCSGHAFLPDGTLLIAGGHIRDGRGTNTICIYDPDTNNDHERSSGGEWSLVSFRPLFRIGGLSLYRAAIKTGKPITRH